jgi:glutaredoxin
LPTPGEHTSPQAQTPVEHLNTFVDLRRKGAAMAGDTAERREGITMFWRPGCGFCAALRVRLRAAGVVFDEVNIWEDPEARAFVRSVAGGNETVPTVRIGTAALVNPSLRAVIDVAHQHAPAAVADAVEPRSLLGWLRALLGQRRQVGP